MRLSFWEKKIIFLSIGDVFNGLAAGWLFASAVSLSSFAWGDLLNALFLGIMCLIASIGIRLRFK